MRIYAAQDPDPDPGQKKFRTLRTEQCQVGMKIIPPTLFKAFWLLDFIILQETLNKKASLS